MTAVFTFIATGVMSYISMATPIGPWIAPTLVLIQLPLFHMFRVSRAAHRIALITAGASIAGIIATAVGFSFPTLYFAQPELFETWMQSPLYFASVLAALVLCAGSFGIWIANIMQEQFSVVEKLDYPIGQLLSKMMAAAENVRKAYQLMVGFFSSFLFSLLQQGMGIFPSILPTTITLVHATHIQSLSIPHIKFDLWPLLWAIGFVAGHLIAVPLLVGSICKIMVLDPINILFFDYIKNSEFVLAFCSGMVISSAALGMIMHPIHWYKLLKNWFNSDRNNKNKKRFINKSQMIEGLVVIFLSIIFLSYFKMPFITQIYLLVTTAICTYQMAIIAGKIGLAQLGRWATFVMVPALFLFNLSLVQLVLIATFVEISGGVACDVLFGRKLAQLNSIATHKMKVYQYIGLLCTVACIGAVFWLLISHFGLGTEQLFASRAQARTLLLMAQSFNGYVIALGFIFGYGLTIIKLNPLLVLGGLLMPINLTIGLVFGGFLSALVKDKDEYIPFWSGVFAAGSIWMLLRALI